MDSIVIKVDRDIVLKQYQIEDSEILYNLVDKNRIFLAEWMPWIPLTKSVADTKTFIEGALEAFGNNGNFEMGVWYKEQLAGGIGIHDLRSNDKSVAIGYWLSHEFWGEGIMTKSVKKLLDYLFYEMKLNRVEIRCAVGNDRSCAIPKRLDFKFEGILRQAEKFSDHYKDLNVYSILASEWKN